MIKFGCAIFASFVLFGLCNGMESSISCDAVLKTGNFKVNVGQIFNASIGWHENGRRFDCYGHHYNACVDYIVNKFLKDTDNFNLTMLNSNNVTMGQAFCNKFPHVTQSKLEVGQSYDCFDSMTYGGKGTLAVELYPGTFSQQNLECKNGKAIITGTGSNLNSKVGTTLSLLSLSLVYLSRFI